MGFYKKNWHFRGHRNNVNGNIVTHPAYIVGEEGDNYLCYNLTHSPMKSKGHFNYRLKVNPDPKDKKKHSYLRKQLQIAPKRTFTDWIYSEMKMWPEDKAFVEKLNKKKKKK